jgi:hypothetical protein
MHDVLGLAAGDAEWSRVAPVLDAAIDELGETDRGAVLARFVERQTFGEIGAALRISEDAARMRVERALEKLRAVLTRRGVVSTSAALGVALANHAVAAAPAGLVGTVTMAAVDAGVASSWAGVALFMANTKLTVGIAGALAVATLVIVTREGAARRDAEQALATANRAYAAQLAQTREQEHRTHTAEQATAGLTKRVDEAKAAAASAAAAAETQSIGRGEIVSRTSSRCERCARRVGKCVDADPVGAVYPRARIEPGSGGRVFVAYPGDVDGSGPGARRQGTVARCGPEAAPERTEPPPTGAAR